MWESLTYTWNYLYHYSVTICLESPLLQSFFPGTVSRRFLYNFVLLYGKGNSIVPSLPLIYQYGFNYKFSSSLSVFREYYERKVVLMGLWNQKKWEMMDILGSGGGTFSRLSGGSRNSLKPLEAEKNCTLGSVGKKWLGDVLEVTPQFILEPILLLDFKNRS